MLQLQGSSFKVGGPVALCIPRGGGRSAWAGAREASSNRSTPRSSRGTAESATSAVPSGRAQAWSRPPQQTRSLQLGRWVGGRACANHVHV